MSFGWQSSTKSDFQLFIVINLAVFVIIKMHNTTTPLKRHVPSRISLGRFFLFSRKLFPLRESLIGIII